MEIVFTDHAKARLFFRKIPKHWIVMAIKNPYRIVDVFQERKQAAIKSINNHKFGVIYVKESEEFVIITVFWGE